MRHDAEFIKDGNILMSLWSKGEKCPYQNSERDFIFKEKASLWEEGEPKLRGYKLFKALCKEKHIKI